MRGERNRETDAEGTVSRKEHSRMGETGKEAVHSANTYVPCAEHTVRKETARSPFVTS